MLPLSFCIFLESDCFYLSIFSKNRPPRTVGCPWGVSLLSLVSRRNIPPRYLALGLSYFNDRYRSMWSEPVRAIRVVAMKYQHMGTKQKKNRLAE